MDKITLPHPTPRMDAAWKRRGGTAMYDEGCALERENQTLRNAQKSCESCVSVFTIREFRDLEKHRDALIEENDNLATERDSLLAARAECIAALRLGRGAEDHLARQALLRKLGEK